MDDGILNLSKLCEALAQRGSMSDRYYFMMQMEKFIETLKPLMDKYLKKDRTLTPEEIERLKELMEKIDK